MWVISNHTGSEGRVDVLERRPSAQAFKDSIHNHPFFGPIFGNSALGVEIFLLLSGLLAARSWLNKRNANVAGNSNSEANRSFATRTLSFLGHRWIRLFPSFAVFLWLASGCLVEALLPRYTETMVSNCGASGVLSHLTFVGNWQSTPTCLGYLWYISLDFQLYILAPIFLAVLERRPRAGLLLAIGTTVASCILRAVYCTTYGVCNKSDVDIPFIFYPDQDPSKLAEIYAGLWEMYARPCTKCGPFLIGILLGYITVQYPVGPNQPSIFKCARTVSLLNTVATCGLVGSVFAILPEYWYPDQGDTVYNTIYTAVFRTTFSASLAWIVAAFTYRDDVHFSDGSSIFTIKLWSVLAKLTYWAFMLHMLVVYAFNHVRFLQTAQGPVGVLAAVPFITILSYLAAFVFFMLVESPCSRIFSFHRNSAMLSGGAGILLYTKTAISSKTRA